MQCGPTNFVTEAAACPRLLIYLFVFLFVGVGSSPSNPMRHTGDLGEPGKKLVPSDFNSVYLFFADRDSEEEESTESTEVFNTDDDSEKTIDPDPLSVVWYLGAFSGLIVFFLVVSFSEWCCASKHLYRSGATPPPAYSHQGYNRTPETPPPPYHLFAPPPYTEAAEKREPIFVIPVHQAPVPQISQ